VIARKVGVRTATLLTTVLAAGAAVVAAQLPAYAASTCTTSDASGSCGPYTYSQITGSDGNNTYVNNNVWNAISGWSETLNATSPGNWSVVANMPAGNGAVVSYPDVQELINNVAVSSYSSLTSAFTETMNAHSGTMSEAAYDIWLNNWNYEVMIWNDNNGQDLSSDTNLGAVSIDGQNFTVYRNGPGGSGEELIVSLNSNEQSGTIDILATLKWLESKGYLPSGATLTSIDYGWEISSTGGTSETYQLSSFCIDANGGTNCGSGSTPTSTPSSQDPTTSPPTTAPPTQPAPTLTTTTAPPTQPAPTLTTSTAPPSTSPATQDPTTSPPSSSGTSQAPPHNPVWYWMVTRMSGDAGDLPAPLRGGTGKHQKHRGHQSETNMDLVW
jgi:hypothetical protein